MWLYNLLIFSFVIRTNQLEEFYFTLCGTSLFMWYSCRMSGMGKPPPYRPAGDWNHLVKCSWIAWVEDVLGTGLKGSDYLWPGWAFQEAIPSHSVWSVWDDNNDESISIHLKPIFFFWQKCPESLLNNKSSNACLAYIPVFTNCRWV